MNLNLLQTVYPNQYEPSYELVYINEPRRYREFLEIYRVYRRFDPMQHMVLIDLSSVVWLYRHKRQNFKLSLNQ